MEFAGSSHLLRLHLCLQTQLILRVLQDVGFSCQASVQGEGSESGKCLVRWVGHLLEHRQRWPENSCNSKAFPLRVLLPVPGWNQYLFLSAFASCITFLSQMYSYNIADDMIIPVLFMWLMSGIIYISAIWCVMTSIGRKSLSPGWWLILMKIRWSDFIHWWTSWTWRYYECSLREQKSLGRIF